MKMAVSVSVLSCVFTLAVIVCRMASFIASPLYLDLLTPTNVTLPSNATNTTFPFFLIVSQTTLPLFVWSLALGIILLFFPTKITEHERSHPKKWLLFPGAAQAFSSTLINYSLSGSRTPTYLQAVLANFNIPIQFFTRFLILHKRPSCRKLLCAVAVMAAEFVCLLPSIFPGLEPSTAHKEEGGATGAGRVLFPLLFIGSNIPYAIANVIIERSVHEKQLHDEKAVNNTSISETEPSDNEEVGDKKSTTEINMIYYQFWYSLSLCLGSWLFFWVDVVPGIGTSDNFKEFGEKFVFNVMCVFGGTSECDAGVYLMAWTVILSNTAAYALVAYLLRYSEGANFFIVVMALRSPLLFLFWTLFTESPFAWHPHVHLSTYLSIGALLIMIPAVILYNTGPPEKTVSFKKEIKHQSQGEGHSDTAKLLETPPSSVPQMT